MFYVRSAVAIAAECAAADLLRNQKMRSRNGSLADTNDGFCRGASFGGCLPDDGSSSYDRLQEAVSESKKDLGLTLESNPAENALAEAMEGTSISVLEVTDEDTQVADEADIQQVAAQWDAAAKEHTRLRSAKNAAKAERRDALKEKAKAHKKEAKHAARLKRMGVDVPNASAVSSTSLEPSCSRIDNNTRGRRHDAHRGRMLPKSAHVSSARENAMLKQYQRLEKVFGDGLAGLSGLVLAPEPGG